MRTILLVVVVLLVGAGAYLLFTRLDHTAIGDILKDPREYEGKSLTIAGKVTDRTSLVFVKYFRIEDGTGEIVVVTGKTLPALGSKVRVKGTVEEAFSLGSEQLLVFVENGGKE